MAALDVFEVNWLRPSLWRGGLYFYRVGLGRNL